jgi:hypothetical protein
MKLRFSLPFAFLLAACPVLHAQDAPGVIKLTTTIHPDGTKTVMQSDPEAHTAQSSTYDASNKLLTKTVFNLDDQGQTTGASVFSGKGALVYNLKYKIDGNGRVSEVQTFSAKDVLISRQVYSYDSAGKVLRILSYDANGNEIRGAAQPANIPPQPTPNRRKQQQGNH